MLPFSLPASPGGPRKAAPLLGEHDAEVLEVIKTVEVSETTEPQQTRALPLEGVRVANFGWGWLGPVVGQTLGFLGCRGVQDRVPCARRHRRARFRPSAAVCAIRTGAFRTTPAGPATAASRSTSRNPRARSWPGNSLAQCDVAIENFGPGVMEKLHLTYEELRAVRPDRGCVRSRPPGSGPLRDIRTYGMRLTSITGLDSLTGYLADRRCRWRTLSPIRSVASSAPSRFWWHSPSRSDRRGATRRLLAAGGH